MSEDMIEHDNSSATLSTDSTMPLIEQIVPELDSLSRPIVVAGPQIRSLLGRMVGQTLQSIALKHRRFQAALLRVQKHRLRSYH